MNTIKINPIKAEIIVVDDNAANLKFLTQMLQQSGHNVRAARSGKLAITAAKIVPPDLILLDINMPEMNGYEVCQALKADEELREIPVIFISASNETFDKVKAFTVGGVDYVSKPFEYEEVQARIQVHLELRRQKREIERLRENERVYYEWLSEQKNQMLRIASHDLKSPISVIRLNSQLLKRHVINEEEKATVWVNRIESATDWMLDLVTSLLDLARLETGVGLDRQPIEVNQLIADTIDSMRTQAEARKIDLRFIPIESQRTLNLDRVEFTRVLQNLLSNGIKYTHSGGRVTVECDEVTDTLLINVRDTGIGIPEKAIPHLFDTFYRVQHTNHESKNEPEGTGLGLSIVKAIVEQHDGTIAVKSEVGVGTTFSISLPLDR